MLKRLRIHPVCYGAAALLAIVLPLPLWPDLWSNMFVSDKYMPHGHCYLWETGLIRLHMTTDCLIGIAYVVISSTLAFLVYKGRRSIPFHWMFIAFGLFIIACGATHFMEVWTLWNPQYWLAGAIKLVTAVASVITAAALPPMVPSILRFVHAAKVSEERGRELQARTVELAQINESLKEEMTERRRAEQAVRMAHDEALRYSERRYHTLAQIAPVGIFHTDARGKNIYVNETWCQISGLDSSQAMLNGWVDALHPEDRERIIEEWSKTTAQNVDFKTEYRFLRPDATIAWVLGQARAQRNSVGEIVGFVGTVTDITDRKQAEVMQLQLAAIVSSSDDAIIGQTLDGVVTSWNAGAENIFGYTSSEAIGQHISMLAPPERDEENGDILQKIHQGQRVEHFDTVRIRKDGRRIDVSLTISVIKDNTGRIIGLSKIAQDISAHKSAQAAIAAHQQALEAANCELAQTNTRLSELYQTAQRFVDDVSHEFRTPLSVIKGYSEIMRDGLAGPMAPKQVQFTQLIVDRTRDMAQMVDDLLDTSKLRAGSLRVDRQPCYITAVFAAVRPLIEGRAVANKIRLILEVQPGLPQVFADAEKVARVLVNLAVNAIKFSREGSRVVLWAKPGKSGEVEIGVTDEGPGISPENLAIIFERFRRIGEAPSSVKGFGLGLNIAKELVALNLGHMNVDSELHRGSTFSFTLPVCEPPTILSRLFEHLEALKTPPGQLALLRVIPAGAGLAIDEVRAFLASSAHSADIILASADGAALILFGYSSDPDRWHQRLVEAGANTQRLSPMQKSRSFSADLAGTWPYPGPTADAQEALLAILLDEFSGVYAHA